jgi:putative endonuclease
MSTRQETGKAGEDQAVAMLEGKGYVILDRNYRFMRGELDIVALDDPFIVFVEVKKRSTDTFGRPEQHLKPAQKKKLYETAGFWLHERRMEGMPVRFDIVAILEKPGEAAELTHFKFAFR